jgi:CRP-like cAMP-binding protein
MNETDEIENILISFLNNTFKLTKIDNDLIRFLASQSTVQTYPKKTNLIKQGSNQIYIFIVKKGFIRRYTLLDGKDITLEFAQDNEMITSMFSIVTNQSTRDNIETIEDSVILKFNFEHLKKVYTIYQDAPKIGNLLRDKYFLNLENRILLLQNSSAIERYKDLQQNQPHIIQRAPLGYIASYLGVTQETLSRIRAKK